MSFQLIRVWIPSYPMDWALEGNSTVPSPTRHGAHGILVGVDGDDGIVVMNNQDVARVPLADLRGNYHQLNEAAAA